MDPPEQALVEVGAAALAAPSAAVAGLVAASIAENTKRTYAAALKRLDAGLAGQDLTDDAGPLCTGPVGSTGRRRSRPLRSRIKPGSTTLPSSPPKGGDPRPLVRFSR